MTLKLLKKIAYAVLAALALLMAYHSFFFAIHTHLGLIDDYTDWLPRQSFGQWDSLLNWLKSNFGLEPPARWRPHFELINYVSWGLFDEEYALHHAFRYLVRLSTSILLSASFWKLAASESDTAVSIRWVLTTLVFCIAQFYPICPDARLGPVELWTGFYVAVNFYCILQFWKGKSHRLVWETLFLLSAILCLLVKEINFVLVFALAAAAHVFFRTSRLSFLILMVCTAFAVFKVYQVSKSGGYGTAPLSLALIKGNLHSLIAYMFVSSRVAGLWLPASVAFLGLLQSPLRRLLHPRSLMTAATASEKFVLTVMLCFALFAGISLTFWATALRYYYPLIGPLALLIAFGLLQAAGFLRARMKANAFSGLCLLWMIVFLYGNLTNYLFQFASQAVTRAVERDLLNDAEKSASAGNQLAIQVVDEHESKFVVYFENYRPFKGRSKIDVIRAEDFSLLPEHSVFYSKKQMEQGGLKYEGTIASPSALVLRERYFHILEQLHLSSKGQREVQQKIWRDAGAPDLFPIWHKYSKEGL